MQEFLQQLQLHLNARYPILALLTHEENRIWRALGIYCQEESLPLYRWRESTGFEVDGQVVENTDDPLQALKALSKLEGPSLSVLWDFHRHLSSSMVLRQLRDLCREMGPKGQTILFLCPQFECPFELEKSIAIIDVPLPSRAEIKGLLSVLCKQQNITIPEDRFERFVSGALGLTENEIKRSFSRILLQGNSFSESDLRLQIDDKKKALHRSRYLEYWDTAQLNLDVGGMDTLKSWLDMRKQAFSQRARDFGLPEPKGLFLLGVQGCGKSLMAKAVAKSWKMPLLRLDVAAVFQSISLADQSLRDTIRIAESMSPVVLWIDELEKGFNSHGGQSDALGYFLTWMQEKTKPVFVVATANEVRELPPELLRKGRFDEIFFVDLPDVHERLEILDIHLRSRGRKPAEFDLTLIVEETDLFSGAELEQIVVSGLTIAFAESRTLSTDDLLDAARDIVPLAITMDDKLKDLREWANPRARRATANRRRVDFFADWDQV